jgi:predicted metal-dependent phosphoesterase TrpH
MPNSEAETPVASTVDLHTHSTASDGMCSPETLVESAREAGLQVIGLADHDTTAGLAAAMAAGERLGVTVIPAIEINTDLPQQRVEAHMLGYFMDFEQPEFQHSLRMLRDARALRGERMVQRLRDLGLDVTWERVRELAGGAVGRPHVARALMEKGYVSSVSEAFEKYIGPGRPGYVPRYKLSPQDAVRLIRSVRGVPVLAHPAYIAGLENELLPSLVAAGLQGLECYYGQYDTETVERLLHLADVHGLIPTGGSDYHGPNMHPTPLGGRYVPPEVVDRLRAQAAANHQQPALSFTLPEPKQE